MYLRYSSPPLPLPLLLNPRRPRTITLFILILITQPPPPNHRRPTLPTLPSTTRPVMAITVTIALFITVTVSVSVAVAVTSAITISIIFGVQGCFAALLFFQEAFAVARFAFESYGVFFGLCC